jgi:hypothetical protein
MDRFPEAFKRFRRVVDVDRIESFKQLTLAFGSWAGHKWMPTYKQLDALKVEARKIGIPVVTEKSPSVVSRTIASVAERVAVSWRHETVTVRSKPQDRYRDLKTGRFIRKP